MIRMTNPIEFYTFILTVFSHRSLPLYPELEMAPSSSTFITTYNHAPNGLDDIDIRFQAYAFPLLSIGNHTV